MAKLLPSLENIMRLKVTPTEGELCLLQYLQENLSDEYTVYFQAFLNGNFPDIVIMRRGYTILIIEVKDWKLDSYSINEKNTWFVHTNGQINKIKSPFQQVYKYKKDIFDIYAYGFAENCVSNNNFYNIIDVTVFFHDAKKNEIENLYAKAEQKIKDDINSINLERVKMEFKDYDKRYEYHRRRLSKLRRDKGNALHSENFKTLTKLLKPHTLVHDNEYDEIERCLYPPDHVLDEGVELVYSSKQTRLIHSKKGLAKIKGVAGSGKTIILAKRAVNAYMRHGQRVLILVYNISLRNYIKEKISNIREDFPWNAFEIKHYHDFIKDILNKLEVKIEFAPSNLSESEKMAFLDKLYYSNYNIFKEHAKNITKYDTILIDEIQDFENTWIKILRDFFLVEDGEMVLFGDECQGIYGKLGHVVQGFGEWQKLTKNFRIKDKSLLRPLTQLFYTHHLQNKYSESDLPDDTPHSIQLTFDIFQKGYIFSCLYKYDQIYDKIVSYIKSGSFSNNDITILCSEVRFLRELEDYLQAKTSYETHTTFETEATYQELLRENKNELNTAINRIRKSKKFHFYSNSGKIKFSTIHSYKGFESSVIICIVLKGENPEMLYTALTRAKISILLFFQDDSEYINFFKNQAGLTLQAI